MATNTTKKTTTTKTTETKKPATTKSSSSSKASSSKPATTKTQTTKTTTTKSSSSQSHSRGNSGSRGVFAWGINKLSMYTIVAVALLYALSMVLALCNVQLKVISALQGLATAVMICIVAFLAWKYVSKKELVWRLLYVICLLLVLAGIVIPLVA